MSEELQEVIISNPEWYRDLQYDDAKGFIKDNINGATRSFVAIGYYLKYIKDNQMYSQDGYESIWELAQAEFGISKPQASKFMSINDRFSKDGNSPILLDQYKDFTSSKLSEMLYLTNEQLEQVTPVTTVAEIREIRKPEEVQTSEKKQAKDFKPCKFGGGKCNLFTDPNTCSGTKRCNSNFISDHVPEEVVSTSKQIGAKEILDLIMGQSEAHLVFLKDKLTENINSVGMKAAVNDFMTFHVGKGQILRTRDGQHEYEHMFSGTYGYGKPFETVELRWDKNEVSISADEFMNLYLQYTVDNGQKPSGKCIHRSEYPCTLSEDAKLDPGDGLNCSVKCCWNCPKHSSCDLECNSSAKRPDNINETVNDPTETVDNEPEIVNDVDETVSDNPLSCKFDPEARCLIASKDSCNKSDNSGCMYYSGGLTENDSNSEIYPVETIEADIIQTVPDIKSSDSRLTPMKLKHGGDCYTCPTCGAVLVAEYYTKQIFWKFCPYCGQAMILTDAKTSNPDRPEWYRRFNIGLRDSAGQYIREGDILERPDGDQYRMDWDQKEARFIAEAITNRLRYADHVSYPMYQISNCKIIGSIYEEA